VAAEARDQDPVGPDLERQRLAVGLEQDDQRRELGEVDAVVERPRGAEQPPAARRVVAAAGDHEREGPAHELAHDGPQRAAPRRGAVERRRHRRRRLDPLEQALGLEVAQALGQEVRRDARQAVAQVGEAAVAQEQLAHDEQGPTVADDVERPGHAAELAVGPHRRPA
jgi:hypothetical protein